MRLSVRSAKYTAPVILSKRAGQTFTNSDCAYSVDMLIEITGDNKTEEIPINSIKWNMEDEVWGNFSPKDVLENPKKYKKDAKRIKEVDLSHPIMLYKGEIIDGYHRLAKAVSQNKKTIKAIVVTDKQIDAARIDEERVKELCSSLKLQASIKRKLKMPFPSSYKSSLKSGKKNTTIRMSDERGKYKKGKIYRATSYSGKSWGIKIKVIDVVTKKIADLSKKQLVRELKKLSPKTKVDVIKFKVLLTKKIAISVRRLEKIAVPRGFYITTMAENK